MRTIVNMKKMFPSKVFVRIFVYCMFFKCSRSHFFHFFHVFSFSVGWQIHHFSIALLLFGGGGITLPYKPFPVVFPLARHVSRGCIGLQIYIRNMPGGYIKHQNTFNCQQMWRETIVKKSYRKRKKDFSWALCNISMNNKSSPLPFPWGRYKKIMKLFETVSAPPPQALS